LLAPTVDFIVFILADPLIAHGDRVTGNVEFLAALAGLAVTGCAFPPVANAQRMFGDSCFFALTVGQPKAILAAPLG